MSFLKLSDSSNVPQQINETPEPSSSFIPTPTTKIISPTLTHASKILDLKNWKLTLPTGSEEKPTEIKQPDLSTFECDPWFISISSPSAVRFRAPVNGVTTSGSEYPRSELREMTNGTTNASWSSSVGTHTMTIEQAITALPAMKKHVVAGQIHDAEDDVIVIRLENQELMIDVDGDKVTTLDKNYTLGKRFTIRFLVKDGKTEVFYNSSPIPSYTLDRDYSGAYFKAGAYTQSNCNTEEKSGCNEDNFGEVTIYKLTVTHL